MLKDSGWIYDPKMVEEMIKDAERPFFSQAANILGSSGKGKRALLFKNFEKLGIPFPKPLQVSEPDCVSHAASLSLDTLKVTEIVNGERERWVARSASEFIYHCSRVIIGKNRLRGSGGSINGWAIKGLNLYGSLWRMPYSSADLSVYSGGRSRDWGNNSIPQALFPEAKPYNIREYAIVKNFENACDSLYNGYPIIVASDQGFSNTRDKDGFASPRGTWQHAMSVLGFKDDDRRPAVLIANSWPSYLPGPNEFGLPPSSFWCDAEVFNRMCRFNDTYSMSGFEGFKLKPDARII
jgi:hypothetical protein